MISPQPPAAPKPVVNQPVVTSAEPAAPAGADPLGGLGKSAQEQDDAMAWLESLAAKHGAKAEELVTDPNARSNVAPAWVDKAKTIKEPSAAVPAPVVAQPPTLSNDQTGMWLHHLEESEAETFIAKKNEEKEPSTAAEPPDWMRGLSGQDAFLQISNEPADAEEETPILGAQETPDWLRICKENLLNLLRKISPIGCVTSNNPINLSNNPPRHRKFPVQLRQLICLPGWPVWTKRKRQLHPPRRQRSCPLG